MARPSIAPRRLLFVFIAALLVLPMMTFNPGRPSATAQQDPFPTYESLCGVNSLNYDVAACRVFLGTLTALQQEQLYEEVGLGTPVGGTTVGAAAAGIYSVVYEKAETRYDGISARPGYPSCWLATSRYDRKPNNGRTVWTFFVTHNWCASTTNASKIRCSSNFTQMDAEESAFWTWEGQSGSSSRNKRMYLVNGVWQDPCTSTATGTTVINEHRFRGETPLASERIEYCLDLAAMQHADYPTSVTTGFWRWRQVRESCAS